MLKDIFHSEPETEIPPIQYTDDDGNASLAYYLRYYMHNELYAGFKNQVSFHK